MMRTGWRPVVWGGVLAVFLFLPLSRPGPSPAAAGGPWAQEDAWVKSQDPCFTVKQEKQNIKSQFGKNPSYIQCLPLWIVLDWDVTERYVWSGSWGTDVFQGRLKESFPAYLRLVYNQAKQDQLETFSIVAPAPCCPGKVAVDCLAAEGSFLACRPGGQNCQRLPIPGSWAVEAIPPEDNFLGFSWRRGEGARGQFGSFTLRLKDSAVPKPYLSRARILNDLNPRLDVSGEEAVSWAEVQLGLADEQFDKEFHLRDTENLPHSEVHFLEARVKMHVEVGERLSEVWRVTVEGWEKDDTPPPIVNIGPGKVQTSLPVQVEFDWFAQGDFTIEKGKKAVSYIGGQVTQMTLKPKIVFNSPSLYHCQTVDAQGKSLSQQAQEWFGFPLYGSIQGSAVKLDWPPQGSEVYVVCTPLGSNPGNLRYQQKFGSADFLPAVSKELLPLKDGLVRTGSDLGKVSYRLTLKKMK
jgi:hypothetical protein